MKRLLSMITILGLLGIGLTAMAQSTPSQTPGTDQTQPSQSPSQTSPSTSPSQSPSTTNPSTSPSQSPSTETPSTSGQAGSQVGTQSARSFEGKITKSGDKWVLRDSATQETYQLDDQDKAKQYDGKNVKVMATMDATTNTLHVVDISPADNK